MTRKVIAPAAVAGALVIGAVAGWIARGGSPTPGPHPHPASTPPAVAKANSATELDAAQAEVIRLRSVVDDFQRKARAASARSLQTIATPYELLNDPATAAIALDYFAAAQHRQGRPLFSALRLRPEQNSALKKLLVQYEATIAEVQYLAQKGDAATAENLKRLNVDRLAEDCAKIMSPEQTALVRDYISSRGEHFTSMQLLNDTLRAEGLPEVPGDVGVDLIKSWKSFHTPPPSTGKNPAENREYLDGMIKRRDEFIESAKAKLSPEQAEAMRRQLDAEIAAYRYTVALRERHSSVK